MGRAVRQCRAGQIVGSGGSEAGSAYSVSNVSRATALARLLFLLPVLCAAGRGEAQDRRQGTWWAAGIGVGTNTTSGIDDGKRLGGAAYFRYGGTLNPHVLVAGEVLGWSRGLGEPSDTPATRIQTAVNVTVSGLLYPSRDRGWFLKLGAGAAWINVAFFEATLGQQTRTKPGVSGTIGAGYDMPLNGALSLTWNLDFMAQTFDALYGVQTQSGEASALVFTVGITRH